MRWKSLQGIIRPKQQACSALATGTSTATATISSDPSKPATGTSTTTTATTTSDPSKPATTSTTTTATISAGVLLLLLNHQTTTMATTATATTSSDPSKPAQKQGLPLLQADIIEISFFSTHPPLHSFAIYSGPESGDA